MYPTGTTDTAFVTSIYTNLFNRAPDAAGLAYWVAKLTATETVPAEMTRDVMIEAMKNGATGTDATIIANKATVGLAYADAGLEGTTFSLASVTEVEATKTAALAEVTGMTTGSSFTLTSGNDTFLGTAASDTFTTTEANLEGDTDVIVDNSSVDSDTLAITGTAFSATIDTTGAVIRGIENVNATFDSLAASTLDAAGVTGAATITVAQARAGSGAAFTVTNVTNGSTVKAGTDVNDLTVTMAAADTSVTVDGQAATTLAKGTVTGTGSVTVTANSATTVQAIAATGTATVNAAAATAITATGKTTVVNSGAEATVTLDGVGTTDAATFVAGADITIANGAANAVETINVSGTAAVVATITTAAATTYNATGSNNVTFAGNESMFDGKTVTGAYALELTTVAASDLSKVAAATIIDVAAAGAGALALSVNNNAKLDLSSDVGGALTLNGDDDSATAYLDGTINLTLSENITTAAVVVTNHAATTDGFSTININVTKAQTGFALTAGTADVVVTGSKALVLAATSTAGSVDASAMTAAVTATASATNEVISTGSAADSITVTSTAATMAVNAGAGNDTISTAAALTGSVDGGAGTDTLSVTGAADLSGATLTSIEILSIGANATSVDESLVNGQSIVVNGTAAITVKNIAATLDMSSLSFASTATTVVNFTNAADSTLGQSANLTITGSANADTITTGNGTNSVIGGAGADTITGGTSIDTIIGGAGVDTISAGAGNDIVQGDAGADVIYGAAGNDTITGGEDADSIAGGAGADTISLTETTSVADYLTILALTDGSAAGAAAGTFTGYDVITGFTTGTDKLVFDSTATIDALGTVGTAIVDNAVVVVAADGATTASNDLTATADFLDVDSVVAFLNDLVAAPDYTDGAAGAATNVVAVTNSGTTYLYAVSDGGNGTLVASEIMLLGTVSATLVAGDFII